jgi:hypothetical protein
MLLALAVYLGVAVVALRTAWRGNPIPPPAPPLVLVPDFTVPLGKVRPPLPYRIVSFHRGRADKNLIKLAAQLGFNGVQFQIEGPNVQGLIDFADRDAKEHLVDYCHSLGMKVTLWVHEFSDLPGPWMPEYLGLETADNEKLWNYLDQRYDNILTNIVPNIDGLVLTVVETQVRATDPAVFQRLVKLIAGKCAAHGKSLIVRTFVWYPEEFQNVMGAIDKLPKDTVIMSKVVPQDWQMRGIDAPEIGNVGGRPQIEEYDVCGEYFLKSSVANCMVDLLKKQFDYGLSKNVQGICVRVDRDGDNVLFEPNEVNLWTLGLLAGGVTDNTDDIWQRWATYRYGKEAAPAVIRALEPTADVVAEMLSVGPFTHNDTRRFPTLPDDDEFLLQNWQNWRWNPIYLATYYKAAHGDADFIAKVAQQKEAAMKLADECLANLEAARPHLSPIEYDILYTKLLTNKTQLAARAPMVLATLQYNAMHQTWENDKREALSRAMLENIQKVRDVADTLTDDWPEAVQYRGKTWYLGQPERLDRESLYRWAYDADLCRLDRHYIPAPQKPQPPHIPSSE